MAITIDVNYNNKYRACISDDAPANMKNCKGKEVEEKSCNGPACVPFWSYGEWEDCTCHSLFSTRTRVCKKWKNKDEVVTLNDMDCENVDTDELVIKECTEPKVSKTFSSVNRIIASKERHLADETSLPPGGHPLTRCSDSDPSFHYG